MALINIEADEFEDDELIDELKRRHYIITRDRTKIKKDIDIHDVITDLRDLKCPEEIISQIERHFRLPLVSPELHSLLLKEYATADKR
jgi:hypothetical protein